MTFYVLFSLAGFFFGIVLHFYLFSLVGRKEKRQLEYGLLALLGALLLWYAGNFLSLLVRQMDVSRIPKLVGTLDAVAFTGLALLPALLLHTHWLYYRRNHSPAPWEKRTAYLLLVILYAPLLFLPFVLEELFFFPDLNPLQKLGSFTLPFLIMFAVAYYISCFFETRFLQRSKNPIERGLFRILLIVFLVTPFFNFYVFLWGGSDLPILGEFLVTAAFLSSLVPVSIITYYIYRYQFLQIIVRRSFTYALLILVTLAAYVAGIRRFGQYLQDELSAPALLVEGAFLVAIILLFPSLSRWFDSRVAGLFRGEVRKYRELAEAIDRSSRHFFDVDLLREFIELKLQQELQTPEVRVHLNGRGQPGSKGTLYPLQTGDRLMGYLEIHFAESEFSAGEEEAARLLANEIAVTLERCQLLESKLKTERELSQKSHMEDLGRMAATVAHNVKNPLSSMKTLMQLLREAQNLSVEQREELAMMSREVDRLSNTVTNLLKFSRLENPVSTGEVNLQHLLDSLKSLFRGDLESRNIRLETQMDLPSPWVKSDADSLSDILSNLLSNAIEACASGDKIRIQVGRRNGELEISVEDPGQGISQQVRSRLFEPFVTTKTRGTGLGLAIVKRRVEHLGGTIDFVSPVSQGGTRFTVRLPITHP